MCRSTRCFLLFAAFVVTHANSARGEAVATFQGLGDLPGGSFGSSAYAISSNGSVVVGQGSSSSGPEAFRWTTSGMAGLGDLPGSSFLSNANGVSSTATVVVGSGIQDLGNEAFRWTSSTGLVGLGDLPGGSFQSIGSDVSSNGAVVVGWGTSASGREAFRWTSGTGMVGLGDLTGGGFDSRATGVSADGSVVVGRGSSASGTEAFRWTSATGMVGLGDLAGGIFESVANGSSSNGSAVVGYSFSASGRQAFRWTSSTGMVGLGDLTGGGFNSLANATSSDGSVVVGSGTSTLGTEAFLWSNDSGMQSLASIFSTHGVALTGFSALSESTDITINDNIASIVGYGSSTLGQQAFLATLPIVSASLADELLSLTPGLNSDTLALDVSATKLLYGDVGQYAFDFTTDGIDDLVLDVGTPLFDSYWDETTDSFLFTEPQFRNYYPGINAGSFGSLTFITTVRMTHENGTAINTSQANITFVPEVGPMVMLSVTSLILGSTMLVRHRQGSRTTSIA